MKLISTIHFLQLHELFERYKKYLGTFPDDPTGLYHDFSITARTGKYKLYFQVLSGKVNIFFPFND
jgi:hypothetical protein